MRYYFLGICGTAMASLAVLLKLKGHEVWGTDQRFYPPMSEFLRKHRLPLWEGYQAAHLEKPFDYAVIGNALSRGNVEVEAILERRLPFRSLPEVIRQEFVETSQPIVVAGTHGKTTTTALVSWILHRAGLDPTCLIGGIARNFDASIRLGKGNIFVIEGDEYDCAFFDKRPKFLHYFPRWLILNNLEYDHADIYASLHEIQDGFRKLLRIMPQNGLVVANGDSPALQPVLDGVYSRLVTFGRSSSCQWQYRMEAQDSSQTRFAILYKGKIEARLSLPLIGEFQGANALAASVVARDLGIPWPKIQEALESFQGVRRRLEPWPSPPNTVLLEDFAHHPTAVRETLRALRQQYPGKKLVAIFEPRTNTMVQNLLQKPLARALAEADVVVLTPIHRAEKIPEEKRLSREWIATYLEGLNKQVLLLEDYASLLDLLPEYLLPDNVVVIMTNGDLGGVYQQLRKKAEQLQKQG